MKKHSGLITSHSKISIILVLLVSILSLNFQPASAFDGQWITTGSLNSYHYAPSATLLPNGEVLVAGGCGDNVCANYSTVAEIYNPTTGIWTLTGSMNDARVGHTATLLPDGKVLVAGGAFTPSTILASAEIYDPATGIWTYTDSMDNPRHIFVTTMLPDGQVLAAGGCGDLGCDSATTATAEIYNPATGIWTATGSMNDSRGTYAATLLSNGKVLIAGGERDNNLLTSAELYDPSTGMWSYTGSMNTIHFWAPLVQLANGKVLFTGALGNTSCELYDPSTGTWTYTGSTNEDRRAAAFILLPNGNVLSAGGAPTMKTSAEIYDPNAGSWTSIYPMNTPKAWPAPVLLQNGNVLVVTGTNAELYYENYAPTADAGPDQSVNAMSLVELDGSGSYDPNGDPLTYSWTQISGTPVSLSDPTDVSPTFVAPADPESLIFSLTVTDDLGLVSTADSVEITINNLAPIANAGSDQIVETLSLVSLDGDGSYDPDDNTPLTYFWEQLQGTPVTLSDPTDVYPTFTAPPEPGLFIFSLTVTDSLGLNSLSDEVGIYTRIFHLFLPISFR